MQIFSPFTRIVLGPGACRALEQEQGQRALVVTDPYFEKSGLARRLGALLPGETRIFSQVEPDPSLETVARGLRLLGDWRPDRIAALGGGSALDCAKGLLALGEFPEARLIAIPTTSGTGSEVTSFAVLTWEGRKYPLVDPALRPQTAILDTELPLSMPPALAAEGGMDLLTHCAEAVLSREASPFTDALALEAFSRALALLPAAREGDREARAALHPCATMAGLAFDQAGLGICHALSHALGGRFHCPHGRLNGVLLPHVLTWNSSAAPEGTQRLARAAGVQGVGGLLSLLTRLRRRLQLPSTLRALGIDRETLGRELPQLARGALEDPCTGTNPRRPKASDLEALLLEAL